LELSNKPLCFQYCSKSMSTRTRLEYNRKCMCENLHDCYLLQWLLFNYSLWVMPMLTRICMELSDPPMCKRLL
jgi:hypothetical protein